MAEQLKGLRPAEADLSEIRRLYDLGLVDTEIAERLGWGLYYVRKWRRDSGLKPHRTWKKPDNMKLNPEREKIRAQKEADRAARPTADTSRCVSCVFWSDKFHCCDYLALTWKRRPCKAGRQCVVFEQL